MGSVSGLIRAVSVEGALWRVCEGTYVWSADCEVAIDSHYGEQADAGHAKENVESCVDLETKQNNYTFTSQD